jgi:hypothetical protein
LGLLEGALAHYPEKATITQEVLNEDGNQMAFLIVKETRY